MKNIKVIIVVFIFSLTSMVLDSAVVEVANSKALANIMFTKMSDDKKRSIVVEMFISDPALKTTGTGKTAIRKLFSDDLNVVKTAEDKAKNVGGTGTATALAPDIQNKINEVKGKSGSELNTKFLDAIEVISNKTLKNALPQGVTAKEVAGAVEKGLK